MESLGSAVGRAATSWTPTRANLSSPLTERPGPLWCKPTAVYYNIPCDIVISEKMLWTKICCNVF